MISLLLITLAAILILGMEEFVEILGWIRDRLGK